MKKVEEYMENVKYLIQLREEELEKEYPYPWGFKISRIEKYLEFFITDIEDKDGIREYLLSHPSFPYQKWFLNRIAREISTSPGKYGEKK